jgi:tRNA (adenine22-N1)-methyltransferase
MELGIRLNKIASMVDNCECIADIGTDHAYIPIFLVQENLCNKAIASDINHGPVMKAESNVSNHNLENRIQCRQGGGLTTLKPGEAQCAIIAGMGGNLIRDIIEDSMEVFKELSSAILQPVQNPEVLRQYVYNSGYKIIDEELCYEDGKYYEMMKISYSDNYREAEPIFYEISQVLIEKKHPLIKQYISYKLNKYNKIYNSINESTDTAVARKKEVSYKIEKLEELQKLCL